MIHYTEDRRYVYSSTYLASGLIFYITANKTSDSIVSSII